MLLTSSQVSVAISSVIIFSFTAALFLSGYVLQQHTLRDLRAAIKPQLVRPAHGGPDIYLPPQFRDDPGYQNRGIVDAVVENLNEMDGSVEKEVDDMVGATRWQKAARKKKMEEEEEAAQKIVVERTEGETDGGGKGKGGEEGVKEKPLSAAERRKRIKEQILAEGEGEGFKGYRRRMW